MSFDPAGGLMQAKSNEDALACRPLKRTIQELTDEDDTQYRQRKRTDYSSTAEREHCSQQYSNQYGAANIGGSANVQLGNVMGNVVHNHICGQPLLTTTAADDADRYDFLSKSLPFHRIDFRINNVKKALLSTCEWLLVHNTFTTWYDSNRMLDHNGFIWIKGKPGCGKSTLMKTALKWMREQESKSIIAKTVVPYFFNARASASLEKSSLGLYRTVVHHLLSQHEHLRSLFTRKFAFKHPGEAGQGWTREELQDFLYDVVECQHNFELYLFIDALDEAEQEEDVRDMIQFLIQLSDQAASSSGSCKLHICLSSRHYPHITIGRGLSLVVEEQPEHGRDIELYITRRLTCPGGSDKIELQDQILAKANRVFLWVALVVEILNQLEDRGSPLSEMKAHLKTIPADLNELFREILAKSIYGIETSVLLFQWIIFVQRALEPTELYMAMEYSRSPADSAWTLPAQTSVPQSDRLKKYILNCSRGLVEIVPVASSQPPVVQFIHETVREFLVNKDGLASILPALGYNLTGISHEILRVACFRALSMTAIPQEYHQYLEDPHKTNSALNEFKRNMRIKLPFLEYASSYIFHHMEQAQTHSISQKSNLEAQINEQGHWKDPFRLWWNVLQRYKSKKVKEKSSPLCLFVEKELFVLLSLSRDILGVLDTLKDEYDNMMYLAVQKGRTDMASTLLNNGARANVRRNEPLEGIVSVLYIASGQGREPLVRMLLDKGAQVNASEGRYGNALQAASFKGHTAVVQLLLDKGANVNAQGGEYGNALYAALARGQEKVVQMLLDKGANVNAQGGEYGNALYAALARGQEKMVQMLLDKGADVNAQGGHYGNALQAASARGQEKMVQMLLDKSADVNTQGGHYGNALQAASDRGHEKVVQMLLDKGADVNAQGGHYGNALQAASAHGHEKVVQMLLDRGADVNVQGGYYRNALQAASERGHEKVVQMLLDKGADVNAQGGHYGNALQAASERGQEKMVQMLLEKGADVNAQGGHYGNALQAASHRGHEKVVQMLLDKGADVNAQREGYGNALQAASHRGHEKVVQMLLDKGADVNAQREGYRNALQAASERGQEKVVQMLLDKGADVNAQGGGYGNALYAASAGGHEKVVQMLLDKGAEVNAQGGWYGNALQAASAGSHEKVVQMLLDKGAEVNAQGGRYGNALQAASAGSHEKVVQMLLDKGAEVNAQGGRYGNALQAASAGSHEKVVQMLLDKGAEVNAQGGYYGNALQAASAVGHEKVMQMLLNAGAR